MCSNKTLFTIRGSRLYLAYRPSFADPCLKIKMQTEQEEIMAKCINSEKGFWNGSFLSLKVDFMFFNTENYLLDMLIFCSQNIFQRKIFSQKRLVRTVEIVLFFGHQAKSPRIGGLMFLCLRLCLGGLEEVQLVLAIHKYLVFVI